MRPVKKTLSMGAIVMALGVGGLAASPGSASAYVVCNAAGDCWHTDSRYRYRPELQVQIHPDNWYFHHDWDHDNAHRWRNHHEGRGYFRNGVWITF